MEHNCEALHKGRCLRLNYRLGQADQTVTVTLVAKSMQEMANRYDTYKNLIAESPRGGDTPEGNGMERVRQTQGDLFEISAEFDLHSVMASTYHSMRPVKPKAILRKVK